MAAGLPAFLSDIPVFREITGGNAFFFPLDESAEAAARLESLCPDHEERNLMASAAFGIASERYKAGLYRRKLIEIYRAGLNRVNIAADIAGLEIEESHLY